MAFVVGLRYSGKFIFDDASTIRLIPRQDLKVTYTTCTGCPGQLPNGSIISITITTPDGIQYLFGTSAAIEYSTTGSYYAGGSTSCAVKTYDFPAVTAWYLKSITNPRTGEVVTFNYSTNRIYYDLSYNESYLYPAPGNYSGSPSSCPATSNVSRCVSTKTDNGVYLTSILSSQGKVDFLATSTTRSDVTVQSGQYRINEVKIYGNENTLLKSYQFTQAFVQSTGSTPSTASTSTYRMYLDDVREYSASGTLVNTQSFEYFNRQSLPPRMSHKQDTWGFFNNKNNNQSSPLPDNDATTLQYLKQYHPSFLPADRTPDPNFSYYGTLKKVTYPTGGTAEYEYEGNQLPVCQTKDLPVNTVSGEYVVFTGTQQTKTKDFYIDHGQWVTINYYVLMNGFRCDGASAKITALDQGNPFAGLTWGGCTQMYSPIELSGNTSKYLQAGNYRLEVKVFQGPESGYPPPFSTSPEEASINVHYIDNVPTYIANVNTGGIRVKKITLSDGLSPNQSPNIVKAYKYTKSNTGGCTDASSGYYMGRPPKYLTNDYSIIDISPGGPPNGIECDYVLCRYYRISSSSLSNITGIGGSIVNYREVWTLDGANGENGKQYFRHEIFEDGTSQLGPNSYNSFLNSPRVDYSWKNGRVVEEKTLNALGQTMRQKLYDYEFGETNGKISVKAITAKKVIAPFCEATYIYTCHAGNEEGEDFFVIYENCGLGNLCDIVSVIYYPCYNQPAGTQINQSFYDLNPYAIEWYDVISQFVYLKKTTDRIYNSDGSGNYVETITDYQYDLPNLRHHMPVKIITANSDGTQYATKTTYPPEYTTTTVTDVPSIAIKNLQDNFIINAPMEVVQTIKKPSQSELVTGGQLTKYKNFGGTRIFPNEIWQVATTSPVSGFSYATISGGNFIIDSRYYHAATLGAYNTDGNLLEWNKKDDQVSSFIYGHLGNRPVAYTKNATSAEVAYTGFEERNQLTAAYNGDWTISGTNTPADWNTAAGYYYTGKTGYKVGTGHSIIRSGLPVGNYVVSFFYRDGQVKVNGTTLGAAATSTWQYAETVIYLSGGTVTVTGAVTASYIDELRLYPADGLMRSFSSDNNSLLVLSATDENSVPVHYEYDNSQRLQIIRDQDRNILQTYEYNYRPTGTALNDIKARTVLKSGQTTITQVNALSGADVRRVFQYLDGLGRPIQINAVAQSPTQLDIVSYQIYDAFAREPKQYLPYTISSNGGTYRTGAATEQSSFTNTWGAGGYGYAETRFEASPLNRVLEQAAPGASWRIGLGHTSEFLYRGNIASEAVRDFTNSLSFAADQLVVTETIDENERKRYTYIDKLGRAVLVKQQMATSPTSEDDHWARTYTVYDDFGRVAAVIPPEAAKKMKTSGNWSWTTSTYASMIYTYTYDSRSRLIAKTLPSGGTSSTWYDRLDRPVLSQDANGFKIFTRYDIIGRPVVSGRYKGAAVPGTSESLYETPNTTAPHYYTTQSFPTDNNLDVYQVSYYDDYDLDNNNSLGTGETYTNPAESGYETAAFLRTRGKATALKIAILKNDNSAPATYLTTRTYYDKEYSVIQVNKQNHLGGADIISSVFDFANRVTKTRRDHTATPPGGTLKTYTIREEYTLDHTGRTRFTRHHIATASSPYPTTGWVVTTAPVYDEWGRLADKRLHASNYNGASAITLSSNFNYLQSLDYTYNIRNWLTAINDVTTCNIQSGDQVADLFKLQLSYDAPVGGGTVQYNGNIATIQWRSYINTTCLAQQQYRFNYDAANRLTAADHYTNSTGSWTFTNSYSESNITYDLNGNLKTYTRRGLTASPSTFGVIDQLTYTFGDTFRPDRLTAMSESGSTTKGFKFTSSIIGNHYLYDGNGNLSQDKHKDLTFAYNHLNLPNSINNSADAYITFTYTAAGEKLTRVAGGTTQNYVSGIEYSGPSLAAIYHAEGRCTPNGSTFYYEYTLKDHLGNARVNWRANGTSVTFLEELHYYPFGMLMEGIGTTAVTANAYKYNGKELNTDLGLNLSDYGARWYDASLGRWWSVDPLAEEYPSWSGYNYVLGNPVRMIDPDGYSAVDYIFMDIDGNELYRIHNDNIRMVTFVNNSNIESFNKMKSRYVQTLDSKITELQNQGLTYDINSIEQLEHLSLSTEIEKDPNILLPNGQEYSGHVEYSAQLKESSNTNLATMQTEGVSLSVDPNKITRGTTISSNNHATASKNNAHYHPGPYVEGAKMLAFGGRKATIGGDKTLPPSQRDKDAQVANKNSLSGGPCKSCNRFDVVISPTHVFFYQENIKKYVSIERSKM